MRQPASVYGFGLVDWRDGWFVAALRQDARLMSHVAQVHAAVARSNRRGRVAMLIADNLRIHTAQGSRLVRSMLTELSGQVYLVYTPAYDPDAHRIEWIWRVSRHVVIHHHHRQDFESLLSDVRTHFDTLTRTPGDLLRHIGSPFAPDHPVQSPAHTA